MKNAVINKKNAKVFKNSQRCIAYEYSHDDKDINIADVEIKNPNRSRAAGYSLSLELVAKAAAEQRGINPVRAIKGRYPDFGTAMNKEVKEIIFVTKGSGKLVIDKKIYRIKEGTTALLLPQQEYYFKGNLNIIASCSPAWTAQQHKRTP
jgi:mannose-6-phosphate isomerase-like protein (cupin superfamily)